jgi:hypothetical protein
MDKNCKNCNEKIDFETFNNCWKCGSDIDGNKPSKDEFKPQKLNNNSKSKSSFFGITVLIILILVVIKIKDSNIIKTNNKNEVELNNSEILNSSQNNNQHEEDYETNDTYFKGTENTEYNKANDGRIYESNACSTCKGSGIEPNRSSLSDEIGRICPMCDGKGVRSY